MNNPKAQFQVNHGNGWQTIAEADIVNGVVNPPNAWTMVRAMQKRTVYTGSLPVEVTVAPSGNPRDTHYADFAQSLARELTEAHIFYDVTGRGQLILVRRAYDLVLHVLWQTTPASGSTIKKYQGLTIAQIANMIPDLTELPEEPQS